MSIIDNGSTGKTVGKKNNKKNIIFLLGPSGSGKTVIAQRLANEIGWKVFDTDAEILVETTEKKISVIFDKHGEVYFRNLEKNIVNKLSSKSEKIIIATGGGLPAIPGMIDTLNQLGTTIYLKASLETLWKRLSVDPKQLDDRPLLKNGGKEALSNLLSKRENIYYQATITLDTDRLSVPEVCDLLAAHIS